jgi:hypothetical protein
LAFIYWLVGLDGERTHGYFRSSQYSAQTKHAAPE